MVEALVTDGTREIKLDSFDPAGDARVGDEDAERRLRELVPELLELQALVQAAEKHGVLVILQGMDAAGKDLTIQQALGMANPEAIRVKHFSEMTDDEALHDFFWRAHLATPARGEWVVFDRSYYEQIVQPIVDGEASAEETEERWRDARDFERILRNGGTIVIKLFLHVSPEEQERRLVERMESDETAWKISASDWVDRRRWTDFMAAWEATMNATATPDVPWLVVPADSDAHRNLAAVQAIVERLRPYRSAWIEERDRTGRRKREEAEKEAPERVRLSQSLPEPVRLSPSG
jgi:PPK2 family polyphosphate:nucleotide phosphotransferase